MNAGRWTAAILAALGFVALGICSWLAVSDDTPDSSSEACESALFPEGVPARTAADRGGQLRISEIWPAQVEIGNHLCVAIAGVVTLSEETRNRTTAENARQALEDLRQGFDAATASDAEKILLQQALADVEAAESREFRPLAPVELAIFLNDTLTPFIVKADSRSGPQIVRFRLEAFDDANHTGAKFWRDLLRGTAIDTQIEGTLPVLLGLSRVADATSISDAVSEDTVTIKVFGRAAFVWGLIGLALLLASFVFFAWATTLLRDNKATAGELRARLTAARAVADADRNDTAKPVEARAAAEKEYARADRYLKFLESKKDADPAGSFSLGRSQMAVWFFLVIVAYVFISMTLGQYLNLISENVLVLLGISGATGLAAIQVSGDKAADRPSKNFVYDILCDGEGPQLQRIQTVAWTLVLGGIFAWVAVQDFRLVPFDTNLLLLMGIASSLYLGFKFQES
jgi:hypothetical protein